MAVTTNIHVNLLENDRILSKIKRISSTDKLGWKRIIMKTPQRLEEFLVWPPIGGAIAFILFSTLHVTLPTYQILLGEYEGAPYYIGYVFPIIMGSVLAWRMHGKFWLGFAWLGFAFYLSALILTLFPKTALVQSIFVVCMCLAILQTVQSAWLKLKRWAELKTLSL